MAGHPLLPDILYLHCHDAGRFVQPYGYPVATPHLQRLAEEGVLFRQTFAAAPTCSPSRAALLTGQAPHSVGMYGLAHTRFGGFRLHDYRQHLAQYLKRAGYRSVLCGLQHEAMDPTWIGYGQILSVPKGGQPNAVEVAARAARELEAASDRPLFLSVGTVEPHRLMGPDRDPAFFTPEGPRGDPRYVRPAPIFPDLPETRQDMADFYEAVRLFDAAVGLLTETLVRTGRLDRTLIIATTDHGIAFPGMKCTLTDHGLGVMLIVRGPGGFTGGCVFDALVSHVDVFPTLCELVGLPIPPWVQGRSLMPLIRQESDQIRDDLYGEITYHVRFEPQRCVRTRRWKYIRRFSNVPCPPSLRRQHREPHETTKPFPNTDPGLTKNVLLSAGWPGPNAAPEQWYDLWFDPMEVCNLADDPAQAEVLADLRERLLRWMVETKDPLLAGRAPEPPCAF